MKNKLNKVTNNLDSVLKDIKVQEKELFWKNWHYIYSDFIKNDKVLERLEWKTINQLIDNFNFYAKKFKNLNYLNKETDEVVEEHDLNNKRAIWIMSNILYYAENNTEVNLSMFKAFLWLNSFKEKLIKLNDKWIIDINNNKIINDFINLNYSENTIDLVENTKSLISDTQDELKRLYINKWLIVNVKDSLSWDKKIELSDSFKNDITNNKFSIKYIYDILSTMPELDDIYVESKWKDTFFYKKRFYTNDPFVLVYDSLNSNLKKINCFDNFIFGYTQYWREYIEDQLDWRLGWYRNNKIYIPAWSVKEIEEKNWKINKYVPMLFNFKWTKYREMWEFSNNNRLLKMYNDNLSYKFVNDLFKTKVLWDIKDITKYQGNINFFDENFYHNDESFQKNIEEKFKNNEDIDFKEFVKYCNFNLKEDNTNHEINFLNWDFKTLKDKISKYENIIVADFESTWLNEFYNSDILTFSYKILDKDLKEVRSKTYYIDNYKENITEWAKWSFDVDDYNNNEKISRDQFVKWIKTLFKKENLFVFHNWYNFDINILKSNFNDSWESIKDLETLDTMILFREKYRSKKSKDFNIYSYSLDNLTKKFKVKNWRDWNNHLSEEDVNILTDLFKEWIDKS